MKIWSLNVGPTCQSLSLSSHYFSLCATVRSNGGEASRSLPPPCVSSWRPIPVSRPSVTPPSRPRRLPELATCLTAFCALGSFPSTSLGRHGHRVSELTVSSRFASYSPWIPNPPQPKLDNLPSFLPDPSKLSSKPYLAGNRSFSGRPPLKPAELRLNADNPPPTTVFFA